MEAIILGLGLVGEGSNREVVRIKCIMFTFYQFALNSGFISLRVFSFFFGRLCPHQLPNTHQMHMVKTFVGIVFLSNFLCCNNDFFYIYIYSSHLPSKIIAHYKCGLEYTIE